MTMSARKSINREHPDYPDYVEKCRAISQRFQDAESEILGRYPEWKGQDHPADSEITPLRRQFNAALRGLQKEYSQIFE